MAASPFTTIVLYTSTGKKGLKFHTASEELHLTKMGLRDIPNDILKFTALKKLYADDNHIQSVPECIFDLEELQVLSFRDQAPSGRRPSENENGDSEKGIDPGIEKLKNLEELYMSANKLTTVPPTMKSLEKMTILDLSRNEFTEIPEVISELTNLQYLGLCENKLQEIPEWIEKLSKLVILKLNRNKIESLPESLTKLKELESLSLKTNQLKSLPAELTNLTKLLHRPLAWGQVESLKEKVNKYNLGCEEGLLISGNPIEYPPLKVCKRGTQAIFEYLDHHSQKAGTEKGSFCPDLIDKLSNQIGMDYEHVGVNLGLDYRRIFQIKMNHPYDMKSVITQMLQEWLAETEKKALSNKEKAQALAQALESANRKDLAEDVHNIINNQDYEPSFLNMSSGVDREKNDSETNNNDNSKLLGLPSEEEKETNATKEESFYEDLLQNLSEKIGDEYEQMAVKLNISHMNVLKMKKSNNNDQKATILEILQNWSIKADKCGFDKQKKAKILTGALLDVNRKDLVEEVGKAMV